MSLLKITGLPIQLIHHSPYGGKNIECITKLPKPFVVKLNRYQNTPVYYIVAEQIERTSRFDGKIDYLAQYKFEQGSSGKTRIFYELEEL